MADGSGVPDTALGVQTLNSLLDTELLALAGEVSDTELFSDPQDGEWNLAQLLAHVGEFPAFFADDLARWIEDSAVEVGRTHEHPVRNATVDGVTDEQPAADELRAVMVSAFAALTATLDQLTDHHLGLSMNNVKYGKETPAAYLGRYVTGHKLAHLQQLRQTIVRVRESGV
jgi:hypothetical protein